MVNSFFLVLNMNLRDRTLYNSIVWTTNFVSIVNIEIADKLAFYLSQTTEEIPVYV
jgi:hypothetical protein